MDTQTGATAPPYTEQNPISESQSYPREITEDHSSDVPPPYEPHADPAVGESTDSKIESSRILPPSKTIIESSSSQPKSSLESSFRKKAKEAAKKVDFYEKHYGFVPKNVMTEAEWKKARKDAPKVEASSNKLKATAYQGHYW